MPERLNMICFGPSDWWGMNPSCTTHIMKRFAREHNVLYVNPVSSDLLGFSGRQGKWTRCKRKLRSLAKTLRQAGDRLYVFSPVFVPIQGAVGSDMVNNALITAQLKLVLSHIHMDKSPIVWVENLRAVDLLPCLTPRLTVYHVSDRFADCSYTKNQVKLAQRERRISDTADVLICVSRRLYEDKGAEKANVHYLPHGVDFELFRSAAESGHNTALPGGAKKPIAGYFGTLTEHNDIDLLMYCARNLPTVSFVFFGQVTGGDYSKLSAMPNVFFPGKVAYDRIPGVCASFDVCLLPWRQCDWIRDCNPLKLMEYMASGRPIVSVPIGEVRDKYSQLLSVSTNKEEFCRAISWELQHDTPERRQARLEVARKHSWDAHYGHLMRIIEGALGNGRSEGSPSQ